MEDVKGYSGKLIRESVLQEGQRKDYISDLVELNIDAQATHEVIDMALGFLSPVEGFMGYNDVQSVAENMELSDGTLWSIPITLNVREEDIKKNNLSEGDTVLLMNDGKAVAVMKIGEIFSVDNRKLSESIYGTDNTKHPGVKRTMSKPEKCLSGKVTLVSRPVFNEPFDRFWKTPREHADLFKSKGWKHIVAHQTRNVPHTGHEWLMKYAWFSANEDLGVDPVQTGVLVSAVVGEKRLGDYIDEAILLGQASLSEAGYFRKDVHAVSFILWDMRYAGPREAIHHAIMRANLGCTHHMFGRDHAGVGDFYKPYDAHHLLQQVKDRLPIKPVFVLENWFCPVCGEITNSAFCGHESQSESFSGSLIRSILLDGVRPTKRIMRPEVYDVVMNSAKKYGFGSPFVTEQYMNGRSRIYDFVDMKVKA